MSSTSLRPTEYCWCGCKTEITPGNFFASGHDKIAEGAMLALRYEGTVARLLAENGFGPDNSIVDAAVADGKWKRCPTCGHPGNDRTMRNHTKMHAKSGRTTKEN
jgi:hypothetical protein